MLINKVSFSGFPHPLCGNSQHPPLAQIPCIQATTCGLFCSYFLLFTLFCLVCGLWFVFLPLFACLIFCFVACLRDHFMISSETFLSWSFNCTVIYSVSPRGGYFRTCACNSIKAPLSLYLSQTDKDSFISSCRTDSCLANILYEVRTSKEPQLKPSAVGTKQRAVEAESKSDGWQAPLFSRLPTDPLLYLIPPESPLDQEIAPGDLCPSHETSQAHSRCIPLPPILICPASSLSLCFSHPHLLPSAGPNPPSLLLSCSHHSIPPSQGSSQRHLFRKEIRDFPGDPVA